MALEGPTWRAPMTSHCLSIRQSGRRYEKDPCEDPLHTDTVVFNSLRVYCGPLRLIIRRSRAGCILRRGLTKIDAQASIRRFFLSRSSTFYRESFGRLKTLLYHLFVG